MLLRPYIDRVYRKGGSYMKTGLVLEGGAMRGIYTAGVLDVFMEQGITFDGVIGVSAGAIHGASYMSMQQGRNIRYYKKYCKDKRFMSYYSLITTGEIVGRKFCYEKLPNELDLFDYEAYNKNPAVFYAVCTNVETGKAEYIRITDMKAEIDYLRASASMPYVSRIVEKDGLKLLDGGVADSIPVEAFQKMGYDRIVAVLTRTADYRKTPSRMQAMNGMYKKYPKFVEALEKRSKNYNLTVERILDKERKGEIIVIRPSQNLHIGRMEKNPDRLQAQYDLGYQDALKSLDGIKAYLNL